MLHYTNFKEDSKFTKETERQHLHLDKELLERSLFLRRGTLPVLLTVPHDGTLRSLANVDLNNFPDSRPRDIAVRCFARDIFIHVLRARKENLNLVIQRVHRSFITEQIQSYFEDKSKGILKEVVADDKETALLLDLHGFTKQPDFGEYDLILGTGHRRTVGSTNADYIFSEFMGGRGYRVYIPQEEPVEGELYGATHPRTLVQKVRHNGLHNLVGLQVEIARNFRTKDATDIGQKLSRDMGDFVLQWNA